MNDTNNTINTIKINTAGKIQTGIIQADTQAGCDPCWHPLSGYSSTGQKEGSRRLECYGIPDKFNNPFRYSPCQAVIRAAANLVQNISSSATLSSLFAEGKMLGVLIVENIYGDVGFLCGFSGNAGGQNQIATFVPPIYDLLQPDGHYRTIEKEISAINSEIASITSSEEYISLSAHLEHTTTEADTILAEARAKMAEARQQRESIRHIIETDGNIIKSADELVKESQHEKAEYKRLKKSLEAKIDSIKEQKQNIDKRLAGLRNKRKTMSDTLQKWIFRQYIIHNAAGESTTLLELFASEGIVPPGGTGECAAPKLLEYAYRNNYKPLAMGEFWFGNSPDTAVRTHGHFYPSCTSKCGPLLSYMLKGLEISDCEERYTDTPKIIYIDGHIAVADKPSGMPSVPGLIQKQPLSEWIEKQTGRKTYPVHRLDMDTSGIIVYALDQETAVELQRQFENRTVNKEYYARLCPAGKSAHKELNKGTTGCIDLPLNADYDERPRQKADLKNGKAALTEYYVVSEDNDGTTGIIFRPYTGRTHQLRVHSAHTSGLGRPIMGDLLYGAHCVTYPSIFAGKTSEPEIAYPHLHLHSRSITFIHPKTGETVTFTSEPPFL